MSTIRAPPKQWDLVNFRGSGGFTGRSPVQVTKSGKHVVEFRVGWSSMAVKTVALNFSLIPSVQGAT